METHPNRVNRPGADGGGAEGDERDAVAADRDRIADERDVSADERDRLADRREVTAEARERAADERDWVAGGRDRTAGERDSTADARERLLGEREAAAEGRASIADETEATLAERQWLADRRDDRADDREHRADGRADEADERDRRADERDARAQWLLDQRLKLHADSAGFAEEMAELADRFADVLEVAAGRGDADRRLRIAAVEREVARVHRRNAARLRDPGGQRPELEALPHLPAFEAPGERQADETESREAD